jgi:hypothetical protein
MVKKVQHYAKQMFEGGNNRNQKLPVLHENCHLYGFKDKTERQSHYSTSAEILSAS